MRTRASGVVLALLLGCSGAPETPRTIRGAFATVYQADDGTKTPKPGNDTGYDVKAVAAWVPSGSGYVKFPVSTAPQQAGGFAIEGVPQGAYFLEVDQGAPDSDPMGSSFWASFYPFVTSTPDLSSVRPGRGDFAAQSVDFTLSIDGLSPWNPAPPQNLTGWWLGGDHLSFVGSQINTSLTLAANTSLPAGATSASKRVPLGSSAARSGLPDASKGDVEFVYQLSTSAVGTGASLGGKRVATRFARIGDLTVPDGTSATDTLSLADAPQTGSLSTNIAASKWAPLLQQSNPAMVPVPGGQNLEILAYPVWIAFPDLSQSLPVLLASVVSPPLLDVNYGPIAYGQFLGSPWHEVRRLVLVASAEVPQPGTTDTRSILTFFESWEAMPATGDPAPVLGPPLSPKIQGLDAFVAQSGVGLTPVISWSPPSLGTPTSYTVGLSAVSGTPLYRGMLFGVYGATSLQLPPGFLEKGSTYQLTISAFQAPWDALGRAPLRAGVPFASADCVAAVFAP
jgi:hypothetical protein